MKKTGSGDKENPGVLRHKGEADELRRRPEADAPETRFYPFPAQLLRDVFWRHSLDQSRREVERRNEDEGSVDEDVAESFQVASADPKDPVVIQVEHFAGVAVVTKTEQAKR